MDFSIIFTTQHFPAIDGIFWQSMFSLLYGRGCYHKSSEWLQNVRNKTLEKKQKTC